MPHRQTPSIAPPPFLATLANPQRWRLIQELARSDRRVLELTAALDEPPNLVSYHLRKLRDQSLVHGRRSTADARDVYYSLDLGQLGKLYLESGRQIHPLLAEAPQSRSEPKPGMAKRVRVLFLCTHNSARSQMAEALLRHVGGARFDVASAGTHPSRVHPLAIRAMTKYGIDLSGHRSKSLEEFVRQTFDYVITVCDSASEACPVFPGAPQRIHWSTPDPSTATGTEAERLRAFQRTAEELSTRIRYLVVFAERKGSL